jgi:hypothetical protein
MTLSTILSSLYRRLNYADTPDTAVTTRLTMFLNERYRRLLTTPALPHIRLGYATFDSVSGQAEYALPTGSIARILAIRETTNDRMLEERSFGWYRQRQPDPTTETGTPDAWVPMGVRAVFRKPAATGVWAVSTAAGDTTQIVTWLATSASSTPRGVPASSTTTLTGTTRVRLGTDTYDDVQTLSLSATCTGDLSFYDAAAAGNLLMVIPAGQRQSRLHLFALSPTPSSALTYYVDTEHAVSDLVNTWDEPRGVPVDFHDLLVLAVLMDEYQHRGDDRYAIAAMEYQKRLSELKAFLYNHRPALQKSARSELAPLGPWYPAQYG